MLCIQVQMPIGGYERKQIQEKEKGRSNLLKILESGTLSWIPKFTKEFIFTAWEKGSKSPVQASDYNKLFSGATELDAFVH